MSQSLIQKERICEKRGEEKTTNMVATRGLTQDSNLLFLQPLNRFPTSEPR